MTADINDESAVFLSLEIIESGKSLLALSEKKLHKLSLEEISELELDCSYEAP